MSGVLDKDVMGISNGGGRPLILAMLKALGLAEEDVSKLETIPYEQLVEAYDKAMPEVASKGLYRGQAPLEGDYYIGEPQFEGFTENAKKIPLMIGSVFGEFSFMPLKFDKYSLSEKQMEEMVSEKFGSYAEDMIAEFRKAYPGKKLVDLISYDSIFRTPTMELIKACAARTEAPVWSYLFAYEFPVQNGKPAWHCSDIPFFFHNIDLVPSANVPGVSDKLQEQIFKAVMAFAHSGDPNHSELPYWEASSEGREITMIFDRTCEAKCNFDHGLQRIHREATPPFSLAAIGNIQH